MFLKYSRSESFPFLFGGTFIEGGRDSRRGAPHRIFPFLFGGTFIEGSLAVLLAAVFCQISLPFRRDFH